MTFANLTMKSSTANLFKTRTVVAASWSLSPPTVLLSSPTCNLFEAITATTIAKTRTSSSPWSPKETTEISINSTTAWKANRTFLTTSRWKRLIALWWALNRVSKWIHKMRMWWESTTKTGRWRWARSYTGKKADRCMRRRWLRREGWWILRMKTRMMHRFKYSQWLITRNNWQLQLRMVTEQWKHMNLNRLHRHLDKSR